MDADLFDEWFRIADRDRDGKVSGGEAVEFFQKSGLSKETLFEARTTAEELCCNTRCFRAS